MRISAVIFAAAFLLSEPAFAQTDPQEPPVPLQTGSTVVGEQDEEASRPDPDAEVICRVVQQADSRLSRRRQRVCGTRTMWEQLEDDSARNMRSRGSVQGARD